VSESYEEALVYFKKFDELEKVLSDKNPPKKDFTKLLSENSYKGFVDKILKIIKEN
jgi:hypothetical protein